MNRNRKAKAFTARPENFYQPSFTTALLALAAAMLLLWHGMARAETTDPSPPQIDSTQAGPSMGCRDQMDFSPEDNLPSPFDADDIAWRIHRTPTRAFARLRVTTDEDACDNPGDKPQLI